MCSMCSMLSLKKKKNMATRTETNKWPARNVFHNNRRKSNQLRLKTKQTAKQKMKLLLSQRPVVSASSPMGKVQP